MLRVAQADQRAPEDGPGLQVERPQEVLADQPLRLPPAGTGRQGRKVDQGEVERPRGVHPLPRLPLAAAVGGAQHRVPARDLAQRRGQGRGVERPLGA